jgi:membrane fusion protein (multidrug efflux system)
LQRFSPHYHHAHACHEPACHGQACHGQGRVLAGLCAGLLLLVASAGCDSGQNSGARSGPPDGFSRGPTFVITELATVREIRDQVEAIGTTRANESVTIAAKVTDTVSRVNFEDGQFVDKGAVLVELTNREQTALLDEAEANLMDARNQARRLEMLAAEGSVPLSQLDEAHARLSASEARFQSIVARLEDRLIHAPFSGLLGFREVSQGTLVTPGSTITTLDDISIIKLDFSIPEVYLNLVREGLELIAISSAFPDQRFEARVRTIGSRVDENTRAAMVRAHIDNPDRLLKPGMLLTVHLTTDVRQVLMVPETALMQRSSQVFVYTINDNKAEMLQIQTGARRDGWIEVFSGLKAGQNVITEGVIKVRDGANVTTELADSGTSRARR